MTFLEEIFSTRHTQKIESSRKYIKRQKYIIVKMQVSSIVGAVLDVFFEEQMRSNFCELKKCTPKPPTILHFTEVCYNSSQASLNLNQMLDRLPQNSRHQLYFELE